MCYFLRKVGSKFYIFSQNCDLWTYFSFPKNKLVFIKDKHQLFFVYLLILFCIFPITHINQMFSNGVKKLTCCCIFIRFKKNALFTLSWKLALKIFLRSQTKKTLKKTEGSINSFLKKISLNERKKSKTEFFTKSHSLTSGNTNLRYQRHYLPFNFIVCPYY